MLRTVVRGRKINGGYGFNHVPQRADPLVTIFSPQTIFHERHTSDTLKICVNLQNDHTRHMFLKCFGVSQHISMCRSPYLCRCVYSCISSRISSRIWKFQKWQLHQLTTLSTAIHPFLPPPNIYNKVHCSIHTIASNIPFFFYEKPSPLSPAASQSQHHQF